jgi:hypothetical protein
MPQQTHKRLDEATLYRVISDPTELRELVVNVTDNICDRRNRRVARPALGCNSLGSWGR